MRKAVRESSHTGDSGDTLRIYPAWDREHHISLASSWGHEFQLYYYSKCMRFNTNFFLAFHF